MVLGPHQGFHLGHVSCRCSMTHPHLPPLPTKTGLRTAVCIVLFASHRFSRWLRAMFRKSLLELANQQGPKKMPSDALRHRWCLVLAKRRPGCSLTTPWPGLWVAGEPPPRNTCAPGVPLKENAPSHLACALRCRGGGSARGAQKK